jgi:hypothetical protein
MKRKKAFISNCLNLISFRIQQAVVWGSGTVSNSKFQHCTTRYYLVFKIMLYPRSLGEKVNLHAVIGN